MAHAASTLLVAGHDQSDTFFHRLAILADRQDRPVAREIGIEFADELMAIEAEVSLPGPAAAKPPSIPTGVKSLLYVGGRPGELQRLRAFSDRSAIELLHRDGGI
jgi:hypothetical protein